MRRQHSAPLILGTDPGSVTALRPLQDAIDGRQVSESDIQALVHAYPQSLPVAEIDPLFVDPIAVCRELMTPAGPIDNFLITTTGLPVIVECKLWRNPQARREVVGQILDYAKELSKWTCADLQREVSRKLGQKGNVLLDLVKAVDPNVSEIEFNDAVTANLKRGRFLLLILGDGIREGVEAIAEYLQAHSGLHFSLGLVEYPIFVMDDGRRLVTPRVLARTSVIVREVIAAPEGYRVANGEEEASASSGPDSAGDDAPNWNQTFWREFLEGLVLDDPEQFIPKAPKLTYTTFPISADNWVTVYRNYPNRVGIFLSSERKSVAGRAAIADVILRWDEIAPQLGGTVRIEKQGNGQTIGDALSTGHLDEQGARAVAFTWLRERTNTFINVLRPIVRSIEIDEGERSG